MDRPGPPQLAELVVVEAEAMRHLVDDRHPHLFDDLGLVAADRTDRAAIQGHRVR
ncbi:MAG: hypothetical protein M5U19_12615 [Microthrixaceae bacterium]|nr:hypothetical protein [Microthrixaceae bacterium]